MRRLKEVYPDYSDRVAVIAISQDGTESEDSLRRYYENNGYSWLMAASHREVSDAYEVEVHSTKYGIDRNGVIVLKGLFGQSVRDWVTWLDQLLTG